MKRKLRITYFLHTTVGEQDAEFYIKDLLNEYFKGLSKLADVTLVGTFVPRQFFHGSKITTEVKTSFLSETDNRRLNVKIKNFKWAISKSDACFLFMPCMSSVLAGLICILLGKPFVTYFGAHWYDLEISKPNGRRLKAAFYSIVSNLLSSSSIYSLYTGAGVLNNHKGRNKYITVPILNLSQEAFFKRRTYKELKSSKKVEILYVGSLTQNKGLDILFNALQKLNNPKLELHIVGDGIEGEKLKTLVKVIGIDRQVTFHGFISNGPELFEFYRSSDIFVLPSFSEGLPRVLYEAAGNGCPIITTPVNSIPYVFKDNYDCLFIQPGSVDDIVYVLNQLITEKELNAYLAGNAYKTVAPILNEKAYSQHFTLMQEYLK